MVAGAFGRVLAAVTEDFVQSSLGPQPYVVIRAHSVPYFQLMNLVASYSTLDLRLQQLPWLQLGSGICHTVDA